MRKVTAMNGVSTSSFALPSGDGTAAFVRRWDPAGVPKAMLMIAHGVSEHAERYDGVARKLAAAAYVVYASDHRGHGRTAAEGKLGDAGASGWNGTLEDLRRVLDRMRADRPNLPVFLLGHSMGSILAQRFIALHGSELAGVVLSGTPLSFAGSDDLIAQAKQAVREAGPNELSQLFVTMFVGFNEPFEPKVTGFEWLSRDAAEVQKYVDDPLSGNPLTNATLADFLPGWAEASSPQTRSRVPRSLPLLLISGALDAAGLNGEAPRELAESYRALGLRDVTLTLYSEARHEIFNETNRDDVVRDMIEWLDARAGSAG